MQLEIVLVQILVLAFTAALWWIARRDLAARVPPPSVPDPASDAARDMAELEQLCVTLETLVTRLARRLDAVEQRQERETQQANAPAPLLVQMPRSAALEPSAAEPFAPEPAAAEPDADPRYLALEALLAQGVTDPVEIARQTGLGRGEVDLIVSLRRRLA